MCIEDECNFDEFPKFNLPNKLTISGTGKKIREFRHMTEPECKPFEYHGRRQMVVTSQSASPRPAMRLKNKFSFCNSSNGTTPVKIVIQKSCSVDQKPRFKCKKPSVFKPKVIKESGSDLWNESESCNESFETNNQKSNRDTPNFEQNQVNIQLINQRKLGKVINYNKL